MHLLEISHELMSAHQLVKDHILILWQEASNHFGHLVSLVILDFRDFRKLDPLVLLGNQLLYLKLVLPMQYLVLKLP